MNSATCLDYKFGEWHDEGENVDYNLPTFCPTYTFCYIHGQVFTQSNSLVCVCGVGDNCCCADIFRVSHIPMSSWLQFESNGCVHVCVQSNVGYPWVTRCLSFEATINCVVELSAIEGYYKSDYILAAKASVICWISFLSIIGEVKTVRSQSCHNLIKSPPPDLRCRSCYTTDDISSLSETRLLVFYSTSQAIVLHPTSLCRRMRLF